MSHEKASRPVVDGPGLDLGGARQDDARLGARPRARAAGARELAGAARDLPAAAELAAGVLDDLGADEQLAAAGRDVEQDVGGLSRVAGGARAQRAADLAVAAAGALHRDGDVLAARGLRRDGQHAGAEDADRKSEGGEGAKLHGVLRDEVGVAGPDGAPLHKSSSEAATSGLSPSDLLRDSAPPRPTV